MNMCLCQFHLMKYKWQKKLNYSHLIGTANQHINLHGLDSLQHWHHQHFKLILCQWYTQPSYLIFPRGNALHCMHGL